VTGRHHKMTDYQKKDQPDSRKPGMTTIRKNAQLTGVKVLMKDFPRPGYSRT